MHLKATGHTFQTTRERLHGVCLQFPMDLVKVFRWEFVILFESLEPH